MFVFRRFGRKRTLLVSYITTTLFGFASAFSYNFPMFATMRFLTGFGISGISIITMVLCEFVLTAHSWWKHGVRYWLNSNSVPCRCWMGGHQASNSCRCFDELGLEFWCLFTTCCGLFCEWLEVPDCHCHQPTVCSNHVLVVRSKEKWTQQLSSLYSHSSMISSFKVIHLQNLSTFCRRWLPESARWLMSNGKVKSAHFYLTKCAIINCREEFMADLKPEVIYFT